MRDDKVRLQNRLRLDVPRPARVQATVAHRGDDDGRNRLRGR